MAEIHLAAANRLFKQTEPALINIIDEFSRECLAIRINRKLKSTDVIDVLADLFTQLCGVWSRQMGKDPLL